MATLSRCLEFLFNTQQNSECVWELLLSTGARERRKCQELTRSRDADFLEEGRLKKEAEGQGHLNGKFYSFVKETFLTLNLLHIIC